MLKHSKRKKSLIRIPRKASNKLNKCSPKKRSRKKLSRKKLSRKKLSRKASNKLNKCSPKKRSRKKLSRKVKNCSKNNSGKLKRSKMNWGWNWRKFFNTKSYQHQEQERRKEEKRKTDEKEEERLGIKSFNLESTFENCNFCKNSNQPINSVYQNFIDNQVFSNTSNFNFTLTKEELTKEELTEGKFIIKLSINANPEYIFTSTLIGKGSFGQIYKLYNKDFKVEFGLKIETFPTEKDISKFLYNKSCNLLKVKYIGENFDSYPSYPSYPLGHFYLMELADGDLVSLADNFRKCNKKNKYDLKKSTTFFRDVAEEIRKQMVCLLKESNYKYVYVDIKLENILYKCIKGENKVKIFLGDLGSAVPNDPTFSDYTYSYKPAEYENKKFILDTNDKKEQTLSWMIGVILLSFIDINYVNNNLPPTESRIQYETIKKNVYGMLSENYGKQFASYLDSDPTKRPNIFEDLPKINL